MTEYGKAAEAAAWMNRAMLIMSAWMAGTATGRGWRVCELPAAEAGT